MINLTDLRGPGGQATLVGGNTIAAGGTDYLRWTAIPALVVLHNLTGNEVYYLAGAETIAPDATQSWAEGAIQDGDMLILPGALKYALYVPSTGGTLYFGTTAKNFFAAGYGS